MTDVFLEELAGHQDRAWALSLRVEKRMSRVGQGEVKLGS